MQLALPALSHNTPVQEVDKFSKAFKDPEFIKLFEEYAKEVSDPKVRLPQVHVQLTDLPYGLGQMGACATCIIGARAIGLIPSNISIATRPAVIQLYEY